MKFMSHIEGLFRAIDTDKEIAEDIKNRQKVIVETLLMKSAQYLAKVVEQGIMISNGWWRGRSRNCEAACRNR